MKKTCYILFLIFILIACALPFFRGDANVDFKIMSKKIDTLVNKKEFKKEDKTFIRKQYELNKGDYEHIVCYGSTSSMAVNEITAVEFTSEEQCNVIMKQLQNRIDQQSQSFAGYAPRETDLLKKAILYTKGNYVILIVHKSAQAFQDSVNDLF